MTPSSEKRDRPEACEIEITPKMIGAGVAVLWDLRGNVGSKELVEGVYRAMRALDPETCRELLGAESR